MPSFAVEVFTATGASSAFGGPFDDRAMGCGGAFGTTRVEASSEAGPTTDPLSATTRYTYCPALKAARSLKVSPPVVPTTTNGPPASDSRSTSYPLLLTTPCHVKIARPWLEVTWS